MSGREEMGPQRPMEDPYAPLEVLDRLEIGPPEIGPSSLGVPYRVVQKDGAETTLVLHLRWEEEVFVPGEPESENLAAMVGAQAALNYGLFARRLVFRGRFDRADRRLLTDMAENTAREILVNRILTDNPYLVGPAVGLPRALRDRYCRARLEFPDEELPGSVSWDTDPERILVLSSGGKESLLGYGLLDELGRDVHPVFINESGRHWNTALNAYRWFRDEVPGTARVWTDVDRLYNGMLRLLSFVRPDFQRLRADIYPLRLWTVAGLVFSALPLARRRGIGRLVVGDEYDTTVRSVDRGVTHYHGLYDQSRWFDEALSRYYRRKGWGVLQFSLLRPLSELLIEKTLVERYPELQALQVSCHSAQATKDRALPCGHCEKCRRVVGMLVALDADPTRCGYTAAQVTACLDALATEGVHQEAAGSQHLRHLLQTAGVLQGTRPAKPHPEVLQLRFHPERSPIDGIPADLRGPLYRLLLTHAEGALERAGRAWRTMDPLSVANLSRPHPGEASEPGAASAAAGTAGPEEHLLGELAWPDAARRLAETDVALLPVGAVEQHGPHLPLDTDAFDADFSARAAAARCRSPKPLVLPLIPYGVSYHHEDFPGTLAVSPGALSRMVHEVGMAAAAHGIKKLVIVNGHGGNVPALQFAAQLINRDARIFTCVESGETSDADLAELVSSDNDVHAGELETSTSLALRPHLVRMERAEAFVPSFSSRYLDFSSTRSVEWYARTARISESGVLGDPTRATAEKGRRAWELTIKHLVRFLEELQGLTLDELHQRRY
jgi:creatinine amidohydrolase/Fe(II)-dependent formamide hydrolase-like protein